MHEWLLLDDVAASRDPVYMAKRDEWAAALKKAVLSLTPPESEEIGWAMSRISDLIRQHSGPPLYDYEGENAHLTDEQINALRPVGFWSRDASTSTAEGLPFPEPSVIPSRLKRRLVDYLRAGSAFAHYKGLSNCRLCSKWDNGSAELTDGVWKWPEGLSHYIDVHGVMLPEEFVKHAVPQGDDEATSKEKLYWDHQDIEARRCAGVVRDLRVAVRALWHYKV